jgi:hypothetical protein
VKGHTAAPHRTKWNDIEDESRLTHMLDGKGPPDDAADQCESSDFYCPRSVIVRHRSEKLDCSV